MKRRVRGASGGGNLELERWALREAVRKVETHNEKVKGKLCNRWKPGNHNYFFKPMGTGRACWGAQYPGKKHYRKKQGLEWGPSGKRSGGNSGGGGGGKGGVSSNGGLQGKKKGGELGKGVVIEGVKNPGTGRG